MALEKATHVRPCPEASSYFISISHFNYHFMFVSRSESKVS